MINAVPSDDKPVINSKCFSFFDWTNVGLFFNADVTRRIASFIIDILAIFGALWRLIFEDLIAASLFDCGKTLICFFLCV